MFKHWHKKAVFRRFLLVCFQWSRLMTNNKKNAHTWHHRWHNIVPLDRGSWDWHSYIHYVPLQPTLTLSSQNYQLSWLFLYALLWEKNICMLNGVLIKAYDLSECLCFKGHFSSIILCRYCSCSCHRVSLQRELAVAAASVQGRRVLWLGSGHRNLMLHLAFNASLGFLGKLSTFRSRL